MDSATSLSLADLSADTQETAWRLRLDLFKSFLGPCYKQLAKQEALPKLVALFDKLKWIESESLSVSELKDQEGVAVKALKGFMDHPGHNLYRKALDQIKDNMLDSIKALRRGEAYPPRSIKKIFEDAFKAAHTDGISEEDVREQFEHLHKLTLTLANELTKWTIHVENLKERLKAEIGGGSPFDVRDRRTGGAGRAHSSRD